MFSRKELLYKTMRASSTKDINSRNLAGDWTLARAWLLSISTSAQGKRDTLCHSCSKSFTYDGGYVLISYSRFISLCMGNSIKLVSDLIFAKSAM